ncbi:MAG TPA: prolipoprotein diacylglyceryl transferase [Bryobacteraceae bacterium]|nr:prolipoprotein diacylglyceryl transferase [Bryobacteraceae bacterium]
MLPKLINIGGFFLPTYGVLVAIGFLVGLWITVRLAKDAKLPAETVTNLAIYCALMGLAGAKLFMFLFDFKDFWNNPRELIALSTWRAAGVYQGGFLAAFVFAFFYMRKNGLPFLGTCDIFSPGIALAQAIGRVGCFAAGCCWGLKCDLPWAVTFRNPDAYDISGTPLLTPLHPAQLYESGADLAIFAFLYWRFRKRHANGEVFGWYLTLYSLARFIIEFFRFHEQGTYGGLSLTQWLCFLTLAAGSWLLYRSVPMRSAAVSERTLVP